VQALMWVGLYQLAYSDISEHAAIHETVEACGQLKQDKYRGLLNAILRRFQREKTELLEGLKSSDVPHYQHPKWLIKLLKKSWPDQWQSICEQANIQAPMCLRVNTNQGSVSEYLQQLEEGEIKATNGELSLVNTNQGSVSEYLQQLEEGEIKATNGELSLTSIYLDKPMDVFALPGFAQGSCSVQDEAAQMAAQLLDPQKGEKILDACSAPGGKTCHLLEHAGGEIELTAMDADELRLGRVHENLERLGFEAKTLVGEAQHPDQWWDGDAFDRILLDVPCSATGVIRRHPDIKLLRQKQDIDNLAQLQLSILQQAWQMLKPGGSLLYATCSILPLENANNIEAFLGEQADADLQKIELSSGHDTGFGWQLFPNANSHDGFFYALLKKNL